MWNLTPKGDDEGEYGSPELFDHEEIAGTDRVLISGDMRDYPHHDSGENFFWKLIIFPFHVFETVTGRHDKKKIGVDHNDNAPTLGAVSAKTMDEHPEGMEHYDKKFKSRR